MLWLRILTCFGLIFGIIFFTCQQVPMYGPTGWHFAFLLINFYQIYRLIGERERLRLGHIQSKLARAYESLTDRELADSLAHAMLASDDEIELIFEHNQRDLTDVEKALRDIAFSRLSRGELINLLVRRMCHTVDQKTLQAIEKITLPETREAPLF